MTIRRTWEWVVGRPLANASFSMLRWQLSTIQHRGINMLHTARPFAFYRRVFYQGRSEAQVLNDLVGKTVIDIGCGYTPYADDSMFRACHNAKIDFHAIDPILASKTHFSAKDRFMARALGSRGRFTWPAPGAERAIATTAENLPFDDQSVDEILCSYLLFVWIEDERQLATIFSEFSRVLIRGGTVKLYPLKDWQKIEFSLPALIEQIRQYSVKQRFVHGGFDPRVSPSLLTELQKR